MLLSGFDLGADLVVVAFPLWETVNEGRMRG